MSSGNGETVEVVEGLSDARREEGLRILFAAFANKFRHGLQNADEFVRLFGRSVDGSACCTAVGADGQLLGIVTYQAGGAEFYQLGAWAALTTFSPLQTARVWFNLWLLQEDAPAADEFYVEAIAVSESARGLGVGTLLMEEMERRARAAGKTRLRLEVIGQNHGARRLYERLGYRVAKTERGFWIWLATADDAVHTMVKPLNDG